MHRLRITTDAPSGRTWTILLWKRRSELFGDPLDGLLESGNEMMQVVESFAIDRRIALAVDAAVQPYEVHPSFGEVLGEILVLLTKD